MEKVLVTGGAGYIGSLLCGELLRDGYSVTVVDSFYDRQNSLATHFHDPKFQVVVGDIRDEEILRDLIGKHDIILPLAAVVGAPACEQRKSDADSINRDAMLAMLQMLSADQTVVMPTTNSAYGSGLDGEVFTEDSPLQPISAYARDKVLVESALMEHPNSVSLRLATVFGMSPRMRLDLLVNNFVHKALRDGFVVLFEAHFTRNYVHVRDVAQAFLLALRNRDEMASSAFNVGLSSANLTKLELAERIKNRIPSLAIIIEDHKSDPDQRNYIVSNKKIEAIGFSPQFSIEDGIDELLRGLPTLSQGAYFNSF